MSYLEQIKGKHIEDLKVLLQDSINMPDVNKQFVGAIREELFSRGVHCQISADNSNQGYTVDLKEIGCVRQCNCKCT